MSKKRILMLMAGLVAVVTLAVGGAACSDDDDGGMASETPTADGEGITVGDLTITGPFARAMMDRGAVFFVVKNDGEEDDAIVSASADEVALTVELHETVTEGASTMMKPVEKIDVAAGEETALEPGGLHVMLTELTGQLAMGDKFMVEVEFENAGSVEFQVEVMSYTEETMGAEEGGM